jgi:hopanoid biosynthesis associated protein HpnK
MVSGLAAADAIARARRMPSLRVGLHLVLVDGAPVLPRHAIPDLVDGDGRLRSALAIAGINIFFRSAVRRQMAAEIDAQFEAFQKTGLPLDHVNAHHHFHLHPTVSATIFEVGRRYGMKALRVPYERVDVLKRIEPDARHRQDALSYPWIRLLKRRVRKRNFVTCDQMFGLAWSGAMTERRVKGILSHLPEGVSEMYVHPATSDRFAGATPGYRYADELAALTAPAVKTLARAAAARTGGFMDVATR